MRDVNLFSVDLNLLKAFDALEQERSVTKAADRLRVGQPALSHSLSRLRELLRDELFVRSPNGMTPTPRALELIGPVRDALGRIENAIFGSRAFDPNENHCFRIGMSDFAAVVVLPMLSRTLAEIAPRTSLSILNADRTNVTRRLDDGEIDLAIGLFPECANWHRKQVLFEEDHLCVFSRKLVKTNAPIKLKEFLEKSHLLVTLQGDERGFVDELLDARKLQRTVKISMPYFLLSGYLLHQLPMIGVLPRRYAELCASMSGLATSPLPFPTPRFAISMLWRSRDEGNSTISFLREAALRALGPERARTTMPDRANGRRRLPEPLRS